MSKITVLLGQKDHRHFNLGQIKAVTIPPQTEEITVKSKEVVQEIYPSENKYIRKVIVDAVALDKPDQTKTTIPTKERQVIKADAGYELYQNIVEPIPDEYEIPVMYDGVTSVVPNKEVQQFETAGKKLDANLTVEPIPDEFADITGVTATAEDVLNGKTFVDSTGATIQGTAELKEDLDTELTAQETAISDLESAIDELPEPKMDRLQWKCDNVKSLQYEFYNYRASSSLDEVLIGLDTSKVTAMNNMCQACTKLTTIPLIDTSSCTNMANMFQQCTSLTTIPQLDTSKVTNMNSMVESDTSLKSIPALNTSQVTNMSAMFNGCITLTTIPLLDMIKVTSVSSMFSRCKALTNLTLKNIKKTLQIGSGSSETAYSDFGYLLTDESLINTAKELWDLTGGTSQKLTVSTPSNARFDAIYVKLVDVTDDMVAEDEYISNKKPCVVCESTDEGAMTLREYVVSKNWALA